MKQSFYSHGKLLITAEYLVLDGANALAVPTNKGQWLIVEENKTNLISWKSLDENGNCWFENKFIFEDKTIKPINPETKEDTLTQTLIKILLTARELNPRFLPINKGYQVETKLEFGREWGLGSSSTLINNIAQWAQVNAFQLLDKSFGGSGYDIACAQNDKPIVYNRNKGNPVFKQINFTPPFKENIFFIYLNQKQSSKEAIKHYQSLSLKYYENAEKQVNELTQQILDCSALEVFENLMDIHEEIISEIIKTSTVKSQLFSDYPHSIKSLGGWGGDFVMVTGSKKDMDYFKQKGFETIISYDEMVLDPKEYKNKKTQTNIKS